MTSLKVRLSRRWNKLWCLTGQVWEARAHVQVLRAPTQVRNAIRYVLNNAFKHACEARGTLEVRDDGIDPYSSGMHFDGWANQCPIPSPDACVALPESYLLREGWKKAPGFSTTEIPLPKHKLKRVRVTTRPSS